MKYVEILIPVMSEGAKAYLESISLANKIFQDRTTVRKSIDETRLIGRAFEHMIAAIPTGLLLNVFTKNEVMNYVNDPLNGYISEQDLIGEDNG